MKRYDLVTNYRCGSAIEEMERNDEDGEWVRYEDVSPAAGRVPVVPTPDVDGRAGEPDPPSPGRWQPIESAPKDGTGVLLFWRSEYRGDVIEWFAYGEYHRFGDGSEGWCGESFHASQPDTWTRLIGERPTHWMPLPPSPGEVQPPIPQPSGDVSRVIAGLPELRGWDEAEKVSDWPLGFCHGEGDYRERVVAYLLKQLEATLSASSDSRKIMLSGAANNESEADNVQRPTTGNPAEREG